MNLPKDLLIYRKRKILMRVLPCAILTVAFAVILSLWGDIIFCIDIKVIQISCYIVFMFLPFIITGVPHKLIDRTYYGTVKKVDIETTTDSEFARPMREYLYFKNTIYLTVEEPDGKLIHKKAFAGKARLQQNLNKYQEGDRVFHLYGTSTIIVLPGADSTSVHCAVCGESNNIADEVCRNCGHSLVKKI